MRRNMQLKRAWREHLHDVPGAPRRTTRPASVLAPRRGRHLTRVAALAASFALASACAEENRPKGHDTSMAGVGGVSEPACGDGRVDPGESCDDRNATTGDGCSEACDVEATCADLRACCLNVICPRVGCNTVPANVCDDGTLNAIENGGDWACARTVADLPACAEGSGGSTGMGVDGGTPAGVGGTAAVGGRSSGTAGESGGEGGESGSTSCPYGTTRCGDACANVTNDADHCGACGVACGANGACSDGKCILELARGEDGPLGIAVGAKEVFWANTGSGTVRSVSIGGGSVRTAADAPGARVVGIDDDFVYWGGTEIGKVPLTGGDPVILGEVEGDVAQLTVQGEYVYWLDDGGLKRVTTDGATSETFDPWADGYGFALTPTYAYWVLYGVSGYIYRTPLAGGVREDVTPTSYAYGLVAVGEDLYWTQYFDPSSIERLYMDRPASLCWSYNATRMVADGEHLYWIETNPISPTIARVALPDGEGNRVDFVHTEATPDDLAVDAKSVYWTNRAAGTVSSTAK